MKHLLVSLAAALLGFASPAAFAQENALPGEVAVGEALPGSFFAVPGDGGPFPALILLGGSEGGDRSARSFAPRFLAEGYAVLGMPYYSPAREDSEQYIAGLPRGFDAIPVDMAEAARDWLAARPEVEAGAIGIYGVSKGAEFALLAGSLVEGFAAIAAIVPSDVVWEGWGRGTQPGMNSSFGWRGEPLPFVPYVGMEEEIAKYADPDQTPRLRIAHDRGRHANPARAVEARIRVENIDEPVLVAGGDADNTWNSGEMAQAIAERRAAAGLETVSLVYTDAGHALSGDGSPSDFASDADLAAQSEVWPATLAFFARELKVQSGDPAAP